MSRIGRKPVEIPAGVKVSLEGNTVNVEGPKGKLSFTHRDEVKVEVTDDGKTVNVSRELRPGTCTGSARADPRTDQQHGLGRQDRL